MNLLLTLNFMDIVLYPSVIAGFPIPRTGVAKVAMNSVKAFRSLVMWEVVLESRYQLDLELPIVLALAMYVRLFRLEFWFDFLGSESDPDMFPKLPNFRYQISISQ